MAKIVRKAKNYRDFTFTPRDYKISMTATGVVTYKATKETGLAFGHPPGPDAEKRDEFLYIQKDDTVSIYTGPSAAIGDIEIEIA